MVSTHPQQLLAGSSTKRAILHYLSAIPQSIGLKRVDLDTGFCLLSGNSGISLLITSRWISIPLDLGGPGRSNVCYLILLQRDTITLVSHLISHPLLLFSTFNSVFDIHDHHGRCSEFLCVDRYWWHVCVVW